MDERNQTDKGAAPKGGGSAVAEKKPKPKRKAASGDRKPGGDRRRGGGRGIGVRTAWLRYAGYGRTNRKSRRDHRPAGLPSPPFERFNMG